MPEMDGRAAVKQVRALEEAAAFQGAALIPACRCPGGQRVFQPSP